MLPLQNIRRRFGWRCRPGFVKSLIVIVELSGWIRTYDDSLPKGSKLQNSERGFTPRKDEHKYTKFM